MHLIKSFKIITGEEVIAEVVRENRATILTEVGPQEGRGEVTSYTIKRPHVLQFQPLGNGQLGLALVPWTLSNQLINEIIIPASSLVIPPFEPSAATEKQYLQHTSGIALAGSGM